MAVEVKWVGVKGTVCCVECSGMYGTACGWDQLCLRHHLWWWPMILRHGQQSWVVGIWKRRKIGVKATVCCVERWGMCGTACSWDQLSLRHHLCWWPMILRHGQQSWVVGILKVA